MSTSAQESNAHTSSILQSQAINSATQKRSLADDGEPTRHQKNKKRRKASNSSNLESNPSVVAVTSIPQPVPAVSTQPLDVTDSPSHRRDEKKKRKRKKRKMSVVTNSEFEDDRAKHKHANGSLSIAPASAASVVSQNSALPRRMKEDTEDLSDLEMSVALRNASEKKKGKEKALPRPPSPQDRNLAMSNRRSIPVDAAAAQEEIQRLKQHLEAQSQLLKKHKAYLTSMQHSLTCQICLDLLYKPFALASCGHVACYGCLVRWFTAPAPGELVPDNQNNNQNNAAPNGIIGNHVYKRKTCPICRARVIERPIEVWAIKDMVNTLVRSKLLDVVPSASAEDATNGRQANQASGSNGRTVQDPWEKVFRPARNVYGNNPWWHDWVGDADEVHERVEGELEEVGMYDTEDHVHRCLDCMHEIWGGQCSQCGRAYPGHPEADDEDGDASDSEEMMEFEEDTDEEIEYGLTLGEVLDRMYGDDQTTWEYGADGEEEEEEFFTDEEGADWGDDPVFGGMGAVIWQDAHDEEPGFAHVEEIHDDGEQHGGESSDNEDHYESSFIDDSEGDRERTGAAETVSGSEDEDMRNTAMQMGRAVRLGGRGARLVVDSEDEGEVRRAQQRNNNRRRV
ncbi:hypothetical protein M378DRAFT_10318 [Amanita muscaria Koide BX008]|uniref:RING-type domain-containing protein n=1 Tax=Amanita muscaria (strain Koide BX008) TaxID=946122 RepID=A0A0C2X9P1_AMAMK|nr:hypothetical protein M378DRAFT_10318 [Amanita muscaria Koide BX008]